MRVSLWVKPSFFFTVYRILLQLSYSSLHSKWRLEWFYRSCVFKNQIPNHKHQIYKSQTSNFKFPNFSSYPATQQILTIIQSKIVNNQLKVVFTLQNKSSYNTPLFFISTLGVVFTFQNKSSYNRVAMSPSGVWVVFTLQNKSNYNKWWEYSW